MTVHKGGKRNSVPDGYSTAPPCRHFGQQFVVKRKTDKFSPMQLPYSSKKE